MSTDAPTYPRPFGVERPEERIPKLVIHVPDVEAWSRYKRPKRGRRDNPMPTPPNLLIEVRDASVAYYPSASRPSHLIVWHAGGLILLSYDLIERLDRETTP